MSFVSDILTPIIQISVYLGLAIVAFLVPYLYIKRRIARWKVFFKHIILKKPFIESDIVWTMEAMDKGWNKKKIVRKMMLKGNSSLKIETIALIYDEIQRRMKREVVK